MVQSTSFNLSLVNPLPSLSQCCNHLVTELLQGGYNLGNGLTSDGLNEVDCIYFSKIVFHHYAASTKRVGRWASQRQAVHIPVQKEF